MKDVQNAKYLARKGDSPYHDANGLSSAIQALDPSGQSHRLLAQSPASLLSIVASLARSLNAKWRRLWRDFCARDARGTHSQPQVILKCKTQRAKSKVKRAKFSIFNIQFSILFITSLAFAGSIREGNGLYDKGDYTAALSRYAEARGSKDSLLVRFNIGAALYKQKKYAEAIQELSPLVGHSDSSLSAQAAYNAACAHFRLGQAAEGGERISSWRSALGLLKRALDFSPDYLKAKQNAEVISRLLKAEVKKQQDQKNDGKQPPLSEAAKRALAKALELVRAGRYAEALSVLQKAREAEPSATALDPYMQRLRDVMDIQAGKKPAAAPDASNALNELEVI